MEYQRLGNTGLNVSRICLGCMSYGDPDAKIPGEALGWKWALREEESRPFFKRALELGINFFDTANVYSFGASEEITGRALKSFARREDVVIATKVFNVMRPGPNGRGLSRQAIMHEVDASLKRLGTDYIDLYQIHRWDDATPIEETMEALHDVVKAGKARYLGASSMWAWQFAKAQHVAETHGWTRFVAMQNHWNLLYREEEREMAPLCRDQGVGMIPWSPLARGRLARAPEAGKTTRSETDAFGKRLYASMEDADMRVQQALEGIVNARKLPHARVALAWLLQKSGVTSPIIGATKMQHLEDAVAALDVELGAEEVRALEAAYVPHPVAGFA
ncbi:MAG TPA: aldo/keto reductase [Polyangia bacterium]|jgi:aryl-alcohol dehydrogenase-like predicted oxidoreductase|nr:aldo/keto reductase [Polyangia bacterium]